MCNTGGARRTWQRGFTEVAKRYVTQAAGYNLGVLTRKLFGVGKRRVSGSRRVGSCPFLGPNYS